MTSVCHVKTPMSHEVLISSSMSSLPAYVEDDSESEKALDSEKTTPIESDHRLNESSRTNPESSEFLIKNLLGDSVTKSSDDQWRERRRSAKIVLKWPESGLESKKKKEIVDSSKHGSIFCLEQISDKDTSKVKSKDFYGISYESNKPQNGDNVNDSVVQVARQQKNQENFPINSLNLTQNSLDFKEKAHKKDFLSENIDINMSDFNKFGRDDKMIPEGNVPSRQLESFFSENESHIKWAAAMNNYCSSFTPAWKLWKDILYRRSIPSPTAPSHPPFPGFHPYLRRNRTLGNPSSGFLNPLSSFPFKLEASKMKNDFLSSNDEFLTSENLSSINEGNLDVSKLHIHLSC